MRENSNAMSEWICRIEETYGRIIRNTEVIMEQFDVPRLSVIDGNSDCKLPQNAFNLRSLNTHLVSLCDTK